MFSLRWKFITRVYSVNLQHVADALDTFNPRIEQTTSSAYRYIFSKLKVWNWKLFEERLFILNISKMFLQFFLQNMPSSLASSAHKF
jgi:hypothetical protein